MRSSLFVTLRRLDFGWSPCFALLSPDVMLLVELVLPDVGRLCVPLSYGRVKMYREKFVEH